MKVGFRVVRSSDWEWGDQDGGDGHVGTIADIGGQGNSGLPSGAVVVVWDFGKRGSYRCGLQGKDDLRILDNGPTGNVHVILANTGDKIAHRIAKEPRCWYK